MKKIIALSLLAFTLSCSTQTVSMDYDRNQDFSSIQNYALFFEGEDWNDLNKNRFETALVEVLQSKQMIYQAQSSNKIQVTSESFVSEQQSSQVGMGVGTGGRGFGTSMGVSIPINSEKLNRIYRVSMRNAADELIWEGKLIVQQPIHASPEVSAQNIQKGIQKLFKKFPPKN